MSIDRDRAVYPEFVTYSCQRGECERCSDPPGKRTVPQPNNAMRSILTADVAPSCTHECHG